MDMKIIIKYIKGNKLSLSMIMAKMTTSIYHLENKFNNISSTQ